MGTGLNRALAQSCVALALTAAIQAPFAADLTHREQAKRIHDRLVGTLPSEVLLNNMADLIEAGQGRQAAYAAMDNPTNPNFYNVTLKNWATPWTNREFDVFQPLNDYSALVIGLVRDEADFRQLLFGDVLYIHPSASPAYSNSSNAHYEALEASGANMGLNSVLQQRTQSSVTGLASSATAGIFTTRAAARAFFIDGTNRAMLRFTLVNHLCSDLEQLKDTSRPSDRIRQDVSRSPGGDSSIFLSNCVGCHSGMDPLAQAFAYYQYEYTEGSEDGGRLVYTPGVVQPKYHINSGTFKYGYVTPNDHWTNYWRLGINSEKVGWLLPATNSGGVDLAIDDQYAEGDGAKSLGQELSNTEAFAYCQVEKAFRTVCLREPAESDRATLDSITSTFKSGYNMKRAFADVAVYCAAHL